MIANLCSAAAACGLLFAARGVVYVVCAFWLLAASSLVYAATRHERIGAIADHAWRFAAKVGAVLLVVLAVLVWMSWGL